MSDVNQAHLEKLESLPEGWELVPLGKLRGGKAKSINPSELTEEIFELYSVPSFSERVPEVLSGAEIGSSKRIVEPNTVLLSKINPRINRVWIVGPETKHRQISSPEWIEFYPTEAVEPKYLLYFMQNQRFREHLCMNVSGVGGSLTRIRPKVAEDYRIPLAPPEQQKHIAAKIEELFTHIDTGIKALKKAKHQLKQYRQSILKAAVTGELTKEWREANKDKLESVSHILESIITQRKQFYEKEIFDWEAKVEKWKGSGSEGKKPKKPKKIQLVLDVSSNTVQDSLEIPNEWLKVNVEFLVTKLGDGLHGTPSYSDGGYYFINGNNLNNGKIVIKTSTKTVTKEESEKHFRPLTERTILVSINGTLGNIAFYSGEKVMLGKSACYFNLIDGISKEYVRWILESVEFQNYIEKAATGSTIKNVPLKAMREFIIPLCSLEEQNEMVRIVGEKLKLIDRLDDELDQQVIKADNNKQSILASAFSGKIN